MSAMKSQRLTWIASQLGEGKSNAQIVIDCMSKFRGVSEATARRDVRDVLQRFQEIEDDAIQENRTKFLEIGWKLLSDCRAAVQFGPAVNLLRRLRLFRVCLMLISTGMCMLLLDMDKHLQKLAHQRLS